VNARRLGALSCLLFVVSWFLPAAYTTGDLLGGRTWGWQAFLFAFSPVLGNDPEGSALLKSWMVTSAASNVLLCATLVLLAWRVQAVSRRLAWALGAATLVNAYWFVLPDVRPALRVGYYLWLLAFALGAAAAGASRRERSAPARPDRAPAVPL
jgi:hypothetical protein